MDYNARMYDLSLNRFVQPDDITPDASNPQNLTKYSYTNNNPINFADPTGHCTTFSSQIMTDDDREAGPPDYGGVCPGPEITAGMPSNGCERAPQHKKPRKRRNVVPPAGLTPNGLIIYNFYMNNYSDLSLATFLGLMTMYEINGLPDAQTHRTCGHAGY